MAEVGESGASFAGSSAVAMENQAISMPTLLEKLHCPQPAAIVRNRRVTINPLPVASEGQKGVATSIPSPSPLHNMREKGCISLHFQE